MPLTLPKIEMPSWLRLPTPSVRAGAASGKPSILEAKVPPVAFDLDQTSLAMVRMGRRKQERYFGGIYGDVLTLLAISPVRLLRMRTKYNAARFQSRRRLDNDDGTA